MDDQQILAEAFIKSLLVGERYYRDSCQWQKLRECYHPDASKTKVDITWYQGDIDGFVQGSRTMSENGSNAIHNIAPVEVTIVGSKAFSVSVGSIVNRFTRNGSEYELLSNCRFLSRLERLTSQSDQTWKMLSLEVIYVNDKISSVSPNTGSSGSEIVANFPRESYKFMAFLLAEKGYQVKQELPGVDDMPLVQKVLDRNMFWLESVD